MSKTWIKQKKNPNGSSDRLGFLKWVGVSDDFDVGRLKAFRTLLNFEFDLVAFVQFPESVADKRLVVNEYIFTLLPLDKAVAFGSVEPLHCAFFHLHTLSEKGSILHSAETILYRLFAYIIKNRHYSLFLHHSCDWVDAVEDFTDTQSKTTVYIKLTV
jgi:hypothetical protein